MNVNEELKRYVEHSIFPQYILNDKGHQIEHIKYVINRCSKLSKNMDVDNNMLYVIAVYHDIGYHIDYKNHEIVSAQIMYNDIYLNKFFSNKLSEKETIEECYQHTLKKFGIDGYANFFVEDTDYNNYLKELQYLLNNKENFFERLKAIITKIK